MTYQGARARPAQTESNRVFAISKIRLDAADRITDVLWGEVSSRSNGNVSAQVVAPVAEVVDAIHDGARVVAVFPSGSAHRPEPEFEVIEHASGIETIALVKPADARAPMHPDVHELALLDG